jgi:hypothetical protein
MKRLLGLLLMAFTLCMQTAYSHPLQTDSKVGITNVIGSEMIVSVYQSVIENVATYPVQSITVLNPGETMFLERTQIQCSFTNIPITPVINIASNIRYIPILHVINIASNIRLRQNENLFFANSIKNRTKYTVDYLPYSRHVLNS